MVFAEGSQGFFSTYLLLANPQTTTNTATVEYLREGETPVTRTYEIAPRARLTVDAGADPELVNRSFGINVTLAQPGVAEGGPAAARTIRRTSCSRIRATSRPT